MNTQLSKMKSDRRKFLRNITLGTGALAAGLPTLARNKKDEDHFIFSSSRYNENHFNMCGYAAPKLERVRIAIIGLGNRGSQAVDRLSYIDGVEITALCDKYPDRVKAAQQTLLKKGLTKASEYSGEEGWKAVCESKDIDLVYTPTPWNLHTPIAVYAMKNGKHAATEVPAAKTLDECWELVETSEKTKKALHDA